MINRKQIKRNQYSLINEKKLVKECLKGDVFAQKQLYDYYSKKMMGTCLRYAKNYEDAQDILQEGFIKVFRKMDTFRGIGSFEGWIRKIMLNTAIEHYRKSKSMMHIVHVDEYDYHLESEENIIESLNIDELLKLIQELPAGYRIVFNMYAIEGYTHKEIAEQLNISAGTSKSQYARARAMLQKKLQVETQITPIS